MSSNSSRYDINERLYYFVEKRDIHSVMKLLAEGANSTKVTSFGRSAVGQATFKGYPDILELLLKSCEEDYVAYGAASPKKLKTDHDSEKTPDGMEGLLWDDEIQSNSHTPDDEWSRLYKYYAQMIEQTGELLANTIKLKDPHCLDQYHQAPIHYAAVLGHVECLHILLENGSPVDITTHNGITPLHLAVQSADIVQLLLKHKGDPNRKTYNTGETSLHVAARMGDVQVVKLLLEHGANINATNNMDRTPLMTAINSLNIDIAYCLISKGAKLNVQDHEGYTALYFSTVVNNIPLTSHLLSRGARLFVTHYLLHYCVRNNLPEMAKLLIEAGENVNVRDFAGCTPLFLAIKHCNENMIQFLLENGAQRFNGEGNIVRELHIAVQNAETVEEFARVARVLLAYGVELNDYNYWCETPVMLAIMLEKYQIAEFLVKEGADVNKNLNIVDNFLLARRTKNLNLLMLLVNAGLKLIPIPKNLKPPPWMKTNTDLEHWLAYTCSSPLSLQQIARIRVRECLMKNLTTGNFDIGWRQSESKLLHLIQYTGLPLPLQKYIYDFDDLPKIL